MLWHSGHVRAWCADDPKDVGLAVEGTLKVIAGASHGERASGRRHRLFGYQAWPPSEGGG